MRLDECYVELDEVATTAEWGSVQILSHF